MASREYEGRVRQYQSDLLESKHIAPDIGALVIGGMPLEKAQGIARRLSEYAVQQGWGSPNKVDNAARLMGRLPIELIRSSAVQEPPEMPFDTEGEMARYGALLTRLHEQGWRLHHFEALRQENQTPLARSEKLEALSKAGVTPDKYFSREIRPGPEGKTGISEASPEIISLAKGASTSPEKLARHLIHSLHPTLGALIVANGIPHDQVAGAVHEVAESFFRLGREANVTVGVLDNRWALEQVLARLNITVGPETAATALQLKAYHEGLPLKYLEHVRSASDIPEERVRLLEAFSVAQIPFRFMTKARELGVEPLGFARRFVHESKEHPQTTPTQVLRDWNKTEEEPEAPVKRLSERLNQLLEQTGIASALRKVSREPWQVTPEKYKEYAAVPSLYPSQMPHFHAMRVLEKSFGVEKPLSDEELIELSHAGSKHKVNDPVLLHFLNQVSQRSSLSLDKTIASLKKFAVGTPDAHYGVWGSHARDLENLLFQRGTLKKLARMLREAEGAKKKSK
ncbi:MAG TPA: hypothetical protein VI874_05040 [Candidatus Norongarragalinales archaeon]|nr:hypothetical protein [Candidatus Norongarragalinales archaeon]